MAESAAARRRLRSGSGKGSQEQPAVQEVRAALAISCYGHGHVALYEGTRLETWSQELKNGHALTEEPELCSSMEKGFRPRSQTRRLDPIMRDQLANVQPGLIGRD